MAMQAESIFDCNGQDGKDNKALYKSLPYPLRLVIKQTQQKIQQAVEINNPGRKIQPTSGLRAPATNARNGGKSNSLHLFGFARDFRYYDDEPQPFIVPDYLECIKSNNCWHVGYKRGI
ncbi:MAG: hypothetical protein ACD_39C00758G0002 [uncultured bacterium]|nr:MAG: hypothetical protein ACD_39C00758G0002 [uncultured bacterium]